MNNKSQLIVLKSTDYRENDAIISGVMPNGKISFVCKGLKKSTSKNAYALSLFAKAEVVYNEYPNKKIQLLKTATVLEANRPLRENLNKQVYAAIGAEIILNLPDGNDLFSFVDELFNKLQIDNEPLTALNYFLVKVLRREGNQPIVDQCVMCGDKKSIVSISIEQGGFICKDCYKKTHAIHLPIGTLKAFRLVNLVKDSSYYYLEGKNVDNKQITDILLDYFEEYTGITLKSRVFFDKGI